LKEQNKRNQERKQERKGSKGRKHEGEKRRKKHEIIHIH